MRHLTPRTVLCGLVLVWLGILLFQPWPYSNDDITHHMMARWSADHLHLALNIWGRAGFTVLHMPAAQCGFTGSQLMSLALTVVTLLAVSAWLRPHGRTAQTLGILGTALHTEFFVLATNALTETVFACFLALGLLAWRRDRLVLAALAFSWTAISRLEGMPLLFVVAGAFVWRFHRAEGSWDSRRLLRLGGLIFLLGLFPLLWNVGLFLNGPMAVAGWKDLVPLIFSNSFVTSEAEAYGSGHWAKFLLASPHIHGPLLVLPLALGLGLLIRRGHGLPVAYFVAFYALQSILWAGGFFRTAGYTRFLSSLAPIGGIAAALGILALLRTPHVAGVLRNRFVAVAALLFSLGYPIATGLSMQSYVSHDYRALREATEIARRQGAGTEAHPLWTNHAGAAMWLGIDLWDERIARQIQGAVDPLEAPEGTIFVYAFGPPRHEDFIAPFYERPEDPELRARIEEGLAEPGGPPWVVHLLQDTRPGIAEHYAANVFGRDWNEGLKSLRPWMEEIVDWLVGHEFLDRHQATGPESAPWPQFVRVFERVPTGR